MTDRWADNPQNKQTNKHTNKNENHRGGGANSPLPPVVLQLGRGIITITLRYWTDKLPPQKKKKRRKKKKKKGKNHREREKLLPATPDTAPDYKM